jgi:hypothetical protein
MAVKWYQIGGALTVLMTSQMNHEKNGNIKMYNIHHEEQTFRNKKLDNWAINLVKRLHHWLMTDSKHNTDVTYVQVKRQLMSFRWLKHHAEKMAHINHRIPKIRIISTHFQLTVNQQQLTLKTANKDIKQKEIQMWTLTATLPLASICNFNWKQWRPIFIC